MKIYEKPLAIINKFEVEDVIAASGVLIDDTTAEEIMGKAPTNSNKTVMFSWD